MNYGELKDQIQHLVEEDEPSFVENLPNFIKRTEQELVRMIPILATRKEDSGVTVSGTATSTLPTDFIYMRWVRMTFGNSYTYLIQKDESYIRTVYPLIIDVQQPKYYALPDDTTILWGPVPNSNHPYDIGYGGFPASITAGNDSGTTWLSDNAEQALLYGSVMEAYIYLKGEEQTLQKYQGMFQAAALALKTENELRVNHDSYRHGEVRGQPA